MAEYRVEIIKRVEIVVRAESHDEAEAIAESLAAEDSFGSEHSWEVGPAEETLAERGERVYSEDDVSHV